MKHIFLLILIGSSLWMNAQTFEGKIAYQNTYTSKIKNVTSEQFTTMMGSTQEYYIKGDK